ncbi:MAG: hypothetical protein Q7S50_02445 [bacterium]|nr:hypothetical protein [bacterium]
MALEEQEQSLNISEEMGYVLFPTESISSKVFVKEDMMYKLNGRMSLKRQRSDLATLTRKLSEFANRIPESRIVPSLYRRVSYCCVIQPKIHGERLKDIGREGVLALLQDPDTQNHAFVSKLLNYFFTAIEHRELYPDIVGYPANPDFFNSINLMADEKTRKMMLCDVGLSPHEDTVSRYGADFYKGENVRTYVAKMREFQSLLRSLPQ